MLPHRNVLIFHSGALGDFILTWPLAVALGRLLPQSRIFYITHGQKGKLAERVLGIESADIESGWHQLFAEPASLPGPAARLLAGAQWVFSFVAGEGSAWARNIACVAPAARLVCLSQSPPGGYGGHLTDYLVEQLHPWTAWEQGVIANPALDRAARHRAAPQRQCGNTPTSPSSIPAAARPTSVGRLNHTWSWRAGSMRHEATARGRASLSAKWNWSSGRRQESTHSMPQPMFATRTA